MIELKQLEKSYGTVQALKGLSLKVPRGCLYGLLGPNGAGKTTTLRILCTLLAPDSGTVSVAGLNALSDPRAVRLELGYVAQEVAIDKILTGRELLQLQGDGDYPGAASLVKTKGVIGPQLQSELDKLTEKGIPVDVIFRQGPEVLFGQ